MGLCIAFYRQIANFALHSAQHVEEKSLVIATHGFTKKTQKTPQKEIDRAEQLRKEYFNSK